MKKPYAVISLTGKQHLVQVGDKLVVDRLDSAPGEQISVKDVLMVVGEKSRQIGQPLVSGAEVILKVIDHLRAPKIRVAKFRAKSRYRKVSGHRQSQSSLEVVGIK